MIEQITHRIRHECPSPGSAIYEFMQFLQANRERIVHHNMLRKRCVIGDEEHLFVGPSDVEVEPCAKVKSSEK